MSYISLPVDNADYDYDFNIELDQSVYNFRFIYNQRISRWLMDISDQFGNLIVAGIVLLNGVDLLAKYRELPVPPGTLYVWDTTNSGLDPDGTNFGGSVLLMYVEAGTT